MSSSEVPNEVWAQVLKRLSGVKDWGRLQQVTRTFNGIVGDHCWTQIKDLKVKVVDGDIILQLNQEQFRHQSWPKLLLLVEELGRKAAKIRSVSLPAGDGSLLPDLIDDVLQRLVSASLEVEELVVFLNTFNVPPLADLIYSIRGSLKSLKFWGAFHPNVNPELHRAFRSCVQLEAIEIHKIDQVLMDSIFDGKTQLKSVKMFSGGFPGGVHFGYASTALLYSGSHLTQCDLDYPFIQAYVKEVQLREMEADHPLQTVKTLTLHDGQLVPFWLFPNLEQLRFIQGWSSPNELDAMLNPFLNFYKEFSEPRLMSVSAHRFQVSINVWLPPDPDDIIALMVCPAASAKRTADGEYELMYVRGNAIVEVAIHRLEFVHHK